MTLRESAVLYRPALFSSWREGFVLRKRMASADNPPWKPLVSLPASVC